MYSEPLFPRMKNKENHLCTEVVKHLAHHRPSKDYPYCCCLSKAQRFPGIPFSGELMLAQHRQVKRSTLLQTLGHPSKGQNRHCLSKPGTGGSLNLESLSSFRKVSARWNQRFANLLCDRRWRKFSSVSSKLRRHVKTENEVNHSIHSILFTVSSKVTSRQGETSHDPSDTTILHKVWP